jgi:peptide/nickel transport system ATP-binding protein
VPREALLDVQDLKVEFWTSRGNIYAVNGISFDIAPGETLGIVGESGCGKSVTSLAILGILARAGRVTSGTAMFEGRDLLKLSDEELRGVRGREIAMIFQDPMTSLNPVLTIGFQVQEVLRTHFGMDKRDSADRAAELLDRVGIPNAPARLRDYPHQFSGGMRQRAMIAMSLSLDPAVLIADEPTTALDVTVQAQILDLIERLQDEFGTAIIMITHDLGVVADMADRVLVMYGGKPVEVADRRTAYYHPHHPYTWGLLQSLPALGADQEGERLRPIKGAPPSLIHPPSGCSFHPRCPYVMDVCVNEEPLLLGAAGDGHLSACHLSLAEKQRIWEEEVTPTR